GDAASGARRSAVGRRSLAGVFGVLPLRRGDPALADRGDLPRRGGPRLEPGALAPAWEPGRGEASPLSAGGGGGRGGRRGDAGALSAAKALERCPGAALGGQPALCGGVPARRGGRRPPRAR